jgi:hypothetical protein
MTTTIRHEVATGLHQDGPEATNAQTTEPGSAGPEETPAEPGMFARAVPLVLLALLLFALIRWRRGLAQGFSTAYELLLALWSGDNWWLVPVVVILLPAAVILVLLQTVPVVAPFVYTVF